MNQTLERVIVSSADKLTVRQEAFCMNYAKTGNATESYIAAGYKCSNSRSAKSSASRLLGNTVVKKRLQKIAQEIKTSSIADISEIQKFLTSVMRNEKIEEVGVTKGNSGGYLSAVTKERDILLKDRIKAAETLAKMQGAFDSKVKVELTVPIFEGEDALED